MNANTRSVLSRLSSKLSRNQAICGVAVGALAATLFLTLGFARITGAAASPIVSNVAPMSDGTIAPLLALDRATEAVAKRVIPSVVEITVVGKQASPQMQGQMQGMAPQDIPEPFRQFFQGPFQQQQQPPQVFQALGTGLIISPDGYIVTNNHVVNGATTVTVTLNDQRVFHDAKVVGTDKATDLAVIKINATGLTSAAWGDSSLLQPGETVLAIGDPMGMNFSVTRGIVSALNRPRNVDDPNARGVFIQTDAAINHGNSGGPLVNSYGQVVGINSEMLTSSGASEGIGFAIPSDLVKPTAASLIKNGKVIRGYLGIEVTDLVPSIADSLNDGSAKGALVNEVNSSSPAQRAGLKPYDVITSFNGHPVTSGTDLQMLAGAAAPGTVAHLEVLRNGTPVTVDVTMGDLASAGTSTEAADNSSASGNGSTPQLGAQFEALTPDLRGQLQLPDGVNGVVVESVTPGGPAMVAGIGRGDVIEQVNQHPVNSVGELQHQLSLTPAGKDILLLVHTHTGNFIRSVHPDSGK